MRAPGMCSGRARATYARVAAAQDDVKLRAAWRVPYTATELRTLAAEAEACAAHGVAFAYAISPGLDITCSSDEDVALLTCKLLQVG